MLLSLASGLAIMLAGAVFLFQLSSQDDPPEPVMIGQVVDVGDMTVAVTEVAEGGGVLDVTIRIGGVDDADGAAGFRLIASGRPIAFDATGDGLCAGTAVVEQTCVVRFDVSTADGTSRVLFYDRGDDNVRWVLA